MANPFDQFASEFSAALPPGAPPPPPAPYYGAPAPAPAPPPPQPIMMTHAPPPQQNPYNAAPPVMDNAYGAAPAEPSYGYPPPQPAYGYGGPPVPHQSPNRYDGAMGATPYAPSSPMGQSVPTSVYMHNPPPDQSVYTAPTSSANDPWGGGQPEPPPALPPLGHDAMPAAPIDANPYGAPVMAPTEQPGQSYGTAAVAPEAVNPYYTPMPPQQHAQPTNPYGAPVEYPPPQPNPHAPVGANPYGAAAPEHSQPMPHNPYGAPPEYSQPMPHNPYGAPPEQPPHNPYGAPPEQPPNPYGAPDQQQQQQQQQQLQPYGAPPPADQYALVPSQQPTNPYANYAPYGQPPPPGPYGHQPVAQYGQHPGAPGYGAPPPPPPPVDPFSVFESKPEPEPVPAPFMAGPDPSTALVVAGAPPAASDDDFWGSFVPAGQAKTAEEPAQPIETPERRVEEEKKGDEGLPPGGEWYDARIFTPTLGVMFFKPQELTDSLFLNADKELVDGLGERPVVAFIVEGSSARSAGVELGHVLLKVNNIDVRSPKEASRLIKEGPRPLPLLFYVPNTDVVVAEGEHMVKYDTKETTAPNSAKDWKPKYVVIGGIIAQPWMMNMYRSKSEYDIAVIETQARRPVSVKVKQFSLQGARIQNDWQGPQMVKYKNKLHPWKYICVLPVARNPIKISSPNLSQLKPVHEGIRRVLLAQQRGTGGGRARPAGQAPSNYTRDEGQGAQYSGEHQQSERSGASSQPGGNYDSPPRQSHSNGGDSFGHAHPQHARQLQQQRAYGY